MRKESVSEIGFDSKLSSVIVFAIGAFSDFYFYFFNIGELCAAKKYKQKSRDDEKIARLLRMILSLSLSPMLLQKREKMP